MKNIFKRITAVVLAAMICFAAIPAFAADTPETIEWYYSETSSRSDTYTCIGEVAEGENTVEYDFEYNIEEPYLRPLLYVVFEAPSNGYYMIGIDADGWSSYPIEVPEKYGEGGKVYGFASYEEMNDDICNYIYYLSAGKNVIGLNAVLFSTGSADINIEYLGEAVNDIVYGEAALDNLLEGEEFVFYSDKEYASLRYFDYEVVFSEKTVKFEEENLYCDIDPETGAYSLTFFDYSENADITTVKHEDIVKNVEVVNLDECLAGIEYYDGSVDAVGLDNFKELKITFADGTVKNYEVDEDGYALIGLPNGREYYANAYYIIYDWDNETQSGEWKLTAFFAGKEYNIYDMKPIAADFESNVERLNENNREWFEIAACDASYRWERITSENYPADEKMLLLLGIPGLYTNAIYQTFCNLVEFAEYYGIL